MLGQESLPILGVEKAIVVIEASHKFLAIQCIERRVHYFYDRRLPTLGQSRQSLGVWSAYSYGGGVGGCYLPIVDEI